MNYSDLEQKLNDVLNAVEFASTPVLRTIVTENEANATLLELCNNELLRRFELSGSYPPAEINSQADLEDRIKELEDRIKELEQVSMIHTGMLDKVGARLNALEQLMSNSEDPIPLSGQTLYEQYSLEFKSADMWEHLHVADRQFWDGVARNINEILGLTNSRGHVSRPLASPVS